MAWTTLSTKTAGVDTITLADLQALADNIDFLRTRPTFRTLALIDSVVTANDTWTDIDFDDTDATVDRHEEWDTDDTFTTTLIGAAVPVGDTRAGNWIVGGRAAYIKNDRNGSVGWRLTKNASEGLGIRTDNMYIGPSRFKVGDSTIQDFAATDTFKIQGLVHSGFGTFQDLDRTKFRGVEAPYRSAIWGIWCGDNSTNASDYTALGFTNQANAAVWWNDTVANLERLYSRPAVGMRASTTQASIGTTFTTVNLGTTEFDTDSMAGTNKIVSNRDAYYFVSCGVDASGATWTDIQGTALQIRLVRNLGGAGEVVLDAVENATILTDNLDQDGPRLVHQSIIRIPSGADLTMQVRIQPSSINTPTATLTLNSGGGTFLRAVEVSADVTATNREFFTDDRGLPSTPVFTGKDWSHLPRGVMNALSRDYVAHLINPPVISVELEDEAHIRGNGSNETDTNWEQIPFNYILHDNWNLYGSKELPGSEIVIPIDGVYVVCLRATFLTRGDTYRFNASGDDENRQGWNGRRGIRIKQNRRTVAVHDRDPMVQADLNHNLSCSGLIVAKAGDLIRGDAFQGSNTEVALASNADSSIAGDARLSVVWVGDSVTWTKRNGGTN